MPAQSLDKLTRAQAALDRALARRDALIIEAASKGAALRTIAARTGQSHTAVRRVLKAHESESAVA